MSSSLWAPEVNVTDTQLREDIANALDPEKGAGMVGYDGDLDYAEETVGFTLKELEAATEALSLQITEGYVSIENYGAVGDGVTDCTAAFEAAMADADRIFIPVPEVAYRVDTPISIIRSGIKILGANRLTSKIVASNNSLPAISINSGLNNVELNNFAIDRTPAATATASGVECSGSSVEMYFYQLTILNQWNGLSLGDTTSSTVARCSISENYGNGINMATGTSGNMVWDLHDNRIGYNNGDGIYIAGVGSATATTLGEVDGNYSIYNNGYGLRVAGLTNKRLNSLRVNGGAFSFNGLGGVYLDTWAGRHRLSGFSANLSGTTATGRQASPQTSTGQGSGIELTANNNDVNVTGTICQGNAHNGILTSAAFAVIAGNGCNNNGANGAAASASRCGISLLSGKFTVTGNSCCNIAGGVSQQHGIRMESLLSSVVSSNNCNSNTVNGMHLVSAANTVIDGNACLSSGTNAILVDAVATTNRITNNAGHQPKAADVVSPGASPWTYTAGNSPESIYIRGGTIQNLQLEALQLAAAAAGANLYHFIALGPNESFTLTYTVAPTSITRKIH